MDSFLWKWSEALNKQLENKGEPQSEPEADGVREEEKEDHHQEEDDKTELETGYRE